MRRRTRTLAAATAVLLATACGTDAAAPDESAPSAPEAGTTTPATPDATPPPTGTAAPTLDPAFAVAPPGRRTGPVTVGDILVSSKATLDPDVVERVADLDGVVAVTTISLSNVPVENKVYNLAAVDPAQYRLFTVADSADFQDQWDRVAGGEVAVASALEERLPLQPDDFVQLGSGGEDAAVHVGAYAPQVEQIDMVVNAKRGEALGMVPDNALVINTGETAPGTLREPIEDIVGDAVSVQNLDAVARYGLDPDAFLSVQLLGSFADAVGVFNYTPTTGGRIVPDPAWVSSHITTEVVPILGSVTCNKYMMPQLKAALAEIVTQGLAAEINPGEYAGCYYPRFIAGSTTLSNHSFGLAFDINVPGNGRGTVGEIDRGVVAIFKRWGFAWGGDWSYTDPMHFELDRIVRPG
ncbi:M15 family metallopeptidase [Nocardioides dongxiaopingii]|uniref:M15 family metallopeptidase n=1 Tax=Nocardioides sp. S-1144 TaxID=2582905 RepID=UPI001161FF55|nr:M15 family metallopeptidase [Nocardioides sp. S-1144]QCW49230.2 M15 family metallopeptidase [Nocardioides sp. S-1144]